MWCLGDTSIIRIIPGFKRRKLFLKSGNSSPSRYTSVRVLSPKKASLLGMICFKDKEEDTGEKARGSRLVRKGHDLYYKDMANPLCTEIVWYDHILANKSCTIVDWVWLIACSFRIPLCNIWTVPGETTCFYHKVVTYVYCFSIPSVCYIIVHRQVHSYASDSDSYSEYLYFSDISTLIHNLSICDTLPTLIGFICHFTSFANKLGGHCFMWKVLIFFSEMLSMHSWQL